MPTVSAEEIEDKATDWIRAQRWNEENLPSDEYLQMQAAYKAGFEEGSRIADEEVK